MRSSLLIVALLLIGCSLSFNSQAEVSKQQAVQQVMRKMPGKLVSVKTVDNAYQIKLLQKDGRVKTVLVDKANGRIIQRNKGN